MGYSVILSLVLLFTVLYSASSLESGLPCQTVVVPNSHEGGPGDSEPVTGIPTLGGPMANLSVDLTTKVRDLPVGAISTTVSTYGSSITSDQKLASVYGKIATGNIVRIPLQWNNGQPCSSAGGGPKNISADAWINSILGMGAKPMIVIGGSADNNFSASDAANMAKRYKGKLYGVVIGNEPDNGGMSINDYINKVYKPAAQAIRAADPSVKIAGPAQASYKSGDLQTFITQCKGLYDIVDYHHYGAGTSAPNDAQLMGIANQYESEIGTIRAMLNGQPQVEIQVGEFNLSWRYQDGAPGGEKRFFTSFNTAWSASAVGHILKAGGRALAYSNQNGPLGILTEAGNQDQGKGGDVPQPLYHGLGMFQGEGLFPSFGSSIMSSSSDSSSVEVYAGSSGNIVLVNKSNSQQSAALTVKGATDSSKDVWASNTSDAYGVPVHSTIALNGGKATVTMQPYQVVTILTGASVGPVDPPVDPPVTPPVTPPVSTGSGLPGVSNGSTGPVALAVQKLLLKVGYTQQGQNGSFGTTSEANVKNFQAKSGLAVTGVVDENTYLALIKAL